METALTWLDLGNGWRNLFLLSCMLQAVGAGTFLAVKGWPCKRSRLADFFTGISLVPLVQYLWTLLLAVVWKQAPRLVYIAVLPVGSAIWLLYTVFSRCRNAGRLIKRAHCFVERVLRLDKPALAALCMVLCMALLIGPACVRFMSSTNSINAGQDTGEYMGMAVRFCSERELSVLLDKNDPTGRLPGNSHFPSLELYMSYGLFHTGGEIGYPADKAAFTGIGMLVFYALAAYTALLLIVCDENKISVLLGLLLFNMIPNLYDSVAGAPRDIWRILGILDAAVLLSGFSETGSLRQYLGKLAGMFLLCFTVMSTHVLCFVTLPFMVAAWVIWRWMICRASVRNGGAVCLARGVGMGLAGAAGVLLAYSGNLWCWFTWKEMSPWRLMTTYTAAPWYQSYMEQEYRLKETTTHLDLAAVKQSVLLDYQTPTGICGLMIALLLIFLGIIWVIIKRKKLIRSTKETVMELEVENGDVRFRLRDGSIDASPILPPLFLALCTLLAFAPMSGLLDTSYYCFSGTFVKLPRYTIQWFFLANAVICSATAMLVRSWPAAVRGIAFRSGSRIRISEKIPVLFVLCLCTFSMIKGVNQTGYTNTFYRYSRGVMENEEILLDNGYRSRYALLSKVADHVGEDQKIILARSGYQYAVHGKGYVLTANPVVPLMALESVQEVEQSLKDMNVAMVATDPVYWDERYFSKSVLSEYLNGLPSGQIIETEQMRLYLLDSELVRYAFADCNTESSEIDNER